MDEAIRKLKSTTFLGRRLTRRQIADVQRTARSFPGLSRNELAHTVCEHLNLHAPSGGNRVHTARRLLEQLEALGILVLPDKDESKRRGAQKAPAWTARSEPGAEVGGALEGLEPLELRVVTEPHEVARWNELIDRHHYLGYRRPVGPHLRYAIVDRRARWLGCLLFSYAARSLPCRDDFIGWNEAARRKRLDRVIGNPRFLIFPWVRVGNLASKALSLAVRRLADDWKAHHGYRPVLVETFVDLSRFSGACYRAANWRFVGETKGKGSVRTPKGVFVHPLDKDFREMLMNGRRPAPRRRPAPKGSAHSCVELWRPLLDAVVAVAHDFDRQWQKRQRSLNTLIVVLFIFRLVLSKNRQGYGATLAELWDQCRRQGVPLPQPSPVSPSAMCNARAKVDETLFRTLHAELLRRAEGTGMGPRWKGHRLFAVDGTKLNLPRPLVKAGYRLPSDNAHYPQGLLSCLYRLRWRVPVDFDLVAHGDERKAALPHLDALSDNDVVVYDRGYFSHALLREHVARGLHPVFRLQANANGAVTAFANSTETDRVVETGAGEDREGVRGTIRWRLVKYEVAGSAYVLGTTLLDRKQYGIADLSDLYHERWGVEELYKVSKQTIGIEDFHGQSERGVKQELFAHFVLIALTRLFSNHGEDLLGAGRGTRDEAQMRVNFKNSLLTVARHLEGLFLQQAAAVRQDPRPYRRGDCFVPAQAASEPVLRAMLAQADRQMETAKGSEGRRGGMRKRAMRLAGKPLLPGTASLSEWRFPLSECHWGGGCRARSPARLGGQVSGVILARDSASPLSRSRNALAYPRNMERMAAVHVVIDCGERGGARDGLGVVLRLVQGMHRAERDGGPGADREVALVAQHGEIGGDTEDPSGAYHEKRAVQAPER